MNYSSRIFLYGPLALVAALALAISCYWYSASSAFAKRLDAVNGREIAPGVTLHFANKTIAGFPFRLDAILDEVTLAATTTHGPITWQCMHFAMHSLDYGELHVVFEAAGLQRLEWHSSDGSGHHVAFTPVLLRASALGRGREVMRADLELFGANDPSFSLAHGELHLRRDPAKNVLELVAMADGLRLAPSAALPMASSLAEFRLSGQIAPAKAWRAFLSGQESWPAAGGGFRAQGGTFDIAMLDLDWGKVEAKGDGVLMLDALARPQGTLRLTVDGTLKSKPSAKTGGILAAVMGAASGTPTPVTLAFKNGLTYVNAAPVGFLDPVY